MKEIIIKDDFYELLPLEEVKHFLRINGNHDDLLILNLMQTAIQFAENFLGFDIGKREVKYFGIFEVKIVLRKPILRIISVKSGEENTFFTLNSNALIPNVKIGSEIEVHYLSGMEKSDFKGDLKTALIAHVLNLYDLKNGSGKVPSLSFEIYNQHRKINF